MSEEVTGDLKPEKNIGKLTVRGHWETSGYPARIELHIEWSLPVSRNVGPIKISPTVAKNIVADINKLLDTWKWI